MPYKTLWNPFGIIVKQFIYIQRCSKLGKYNCSIKLLAILRYFNSGGLILKTLIRLSYISRYSKYFKVCKNIGKTVI
jgi:hypothetical protein